MQGLDCLVKIRIKGKPRIRKAHELGVEVGIGDSFQTWFNPEKDGS